MLHPDLAFGESYMDGDLQIESGDIDDLMALLVANREHWQNHWLARLVLALDTRLARFSGLNFPGRAKRNVAHHYDLKDSLFDNFLDPWRQYSCVYFRSPDEPLDDAQITKLSRIAAKLRLQPQFCRNAGQFGNLCIVQRFIRRAKIDAGILPPGIKKIVKKTVFQIVMMCHISFCPTGKIKPAKTRQPCIKRQHQTCQPVILPMFPIGDQQRH